MSNFSHPSSFIDQELVNIIRKESSPAEKQGMLTHKQMELAYDNKWFRMLIPTVYGGGQCSLPELIKTEEALAWADGSLGWVVTLCAGAGWFGG